MTKTTDDRYSPANIRASVSAGLEQLLAPWLTGRPPGYAMENRMRDLLATAGWLDNELRSIGINDADRRTQNWKFHRLSRTYDIFETASECMIEAVEGRVEQNHKPHRRWG